ncbi:CLIP domain-containing serine protease B10 [Drosophila bipectinata]|uniref:CLIP domain-containing serine protease B10 n=1 Tax=Drosophila bipectinata TaxID=42026 RepID=UPI0038B3F53E
MQSYIVVLALTCLFSSIYAASVKTQECGRVDEAQLKNGELITQPNEHPWIAKIEDDEGRLLCSAVLIDARHALTGAHCAHSPSVEIKNLILGDWNLGDETVNTNAEATQKVPIKKITVHPGYKLGEAQNDLAIIELKHEVVSTDFVQPICLPSAEDLKGDKASGDLALAGFARIGRHDPLGTRRIKVPFESLSSQECHEQFKQFPTELICGFAARSPLSGSALVEAVGNPKKFHLIGIAVVGFYSSEKRDLQGYISIPLQLDWIQKNISE